MPTTTPTATPTTPTMPTTTPTTPTTTTPAASTGSWCIASPAASETALQVAIDYACGYGGADCSAIQSSGSCYNPNTLRDHASYAFNDYYQKNPAPTSCVFGGTAQLSYTDPSSANCRYAATSTSASVTPVTPATPATPMTPTGSTPTDIPSGSTVYGSEPTATPTLSLAVSMSSSSLLLFTATCFLVSLLTANYV
ncbi:Glucan endo-1,3-beta-glucosidase 13 [Vitis vinifera]